MTLDTVFTGDSRSDRLAIPTYDPQDFQLLSIPP